MAKTGADLLAHLGLDETESFAHYGVPGMKWGQRKSRGSSGGSGKGSHLAPKPRMSDDELKSHISRLLLEKQYRELTAPKPSLGKKFLKDVLTDSGKKIATKYATEYGAKAVGLAIAKASAKAAVKAAVR